MHFCSAYFRIFQLYVCAASFPAPRYQPQIWHGAVRLSPPQTPSARLPRAAPTPAPPPSHSRERQPVAAKNAAKSVDNYRRGLRALAALGIDRGAAKGAVALLTRFPASLLPREAQQRLLRAGRELQQKPLDWVAPRSLRGPRVGRRPLHSDTGGGGGSNWPPGILADPPTHPPTSENFCSGKKWNLSKGPELGGRFSVHKLFFGL